MMPVGQEADLHLLTSDQTIADAYADMWNDVMKPALEAAVIDWTADEVSLDVDFELPEVIPIIFPSGFVINILDVTDIVSPLIETVIDFGSGVATIVVAGIKSLLGPLGDIIFADPSDKIPSSTLGYFYRKEGESWVLKKGYEFNDSEDPETWEYYTMLDMHMDVLVASVIVLLIAALIKLDLGRLAWNFSRKVFSRVYPIIGNYRFKKMVKETKDLAIDNNEAIGVIDGVVDTIDTNVGVVDGKIDTIDDEVGIIDGKVDVIDGEISDINGDIVDIDTNIGVIDNKVDNLDSDLVVVKSHIDVTIDHVGDVKAVVDAINAKTDTIDGLSDDILDLLNREFKDDSTSMEQTIQLVKQKIDSMPALP